MTLKMRVLPRFPATIYATNGLTAERTDDGPNITVKPDFDSLVQIPDVEFPNSVYFMAFDKLIGLYRKMSFSDLFAGVSSLGFMTTAVYDPQGKNADAFARANHTGTQAIATITGLQSALDARSSLKGLITSKSSAFVVSVGAGEIRGNNLGVVNSVAFTKNLNAVWAAGSGGGGRLEAAALTANMTYHLHALRKDSDGSFDWGFSTSATAPTTPVGYSWVGRFWSIYTNASATGIYDYTQLENHCMLVSSVWYNTTSAVPDALATPPLSNPCPSGIRVKLEILTTLRSTSSGASCAVYMANGDSGPISSTVPDIAIFAGVTGAQSTSQCANKIRTNTSRQIRVAFVINSGTNQNDTNTGGWEDYTLNRIY